AEGSAIVIYPMRDAAVVDTGAFYALLGDAALEQDPTLFKASIDKGGGAATVTVAQRFERFFGAWPDQAWAIADGAPMHRVGDLFTKTDPRREGETLRDLTPWDKARAVAAIRMTEPDLRFTLAVSGSGGVVPAPGK